MAAGDLGQPRGQGRDVDRLGADPHRVNPRRAGEPGAHAAGGAVDRVQRGLERRAGEQAEPFGAQLVAADLARPPLPRRGLRQVVGDLDDVLQPFEHARADRHRVGEPAGEHRAADVDRLVGVEGAQVEAGDAAEPRFELVLGERAGEDEAEPHPHRGAAEVGLEGVRRRRRSPGTSSAASANSSGSRSLSHAAVSARRWRQSGSYSTPSKSSSTHQVASSSNMGRKIASQERVVDLGLAPRLLGLLGQHARAVAGVVHVRELRVGEAEDGLAVVGEPAPRGGPDDAAVAVPLQPGHLGEEVAGAVALERLVVEPWPPSRCRACGRRR